MVDPAQVFLLFAELTDSVAGTVIVLSIAGLGVYTCYGVATPHVFTLYRYIFMFLVKICWQHSWSVSDADNAKTHALYDPQCSLWLTLFE